MKKPLSLPLPRTAALFIDLQEEHRQDRRYLVEGFENVIANASRLQQAAREHGVALAHCAYVVDTGSARPFHPVMADGTSAFSDKGDPGTAVCPKVAPRGDEISLIKSEASAFGDGQLAPLLLRRGVEWLFICGVWSEACVDASVKQAVAAGFRVILVKDACGSGTSAMHEIAILNLANRLYGGAVVDTEAACRLMAGDTVDAWLVEGAVPIRYTYATASALYAGL